MTQLSVRHALIQDLSAYSTRQRSDLLGVVVHRIEVSQEDPDYRDSPPEVLRFFERHPTGVAATGGKMPYSVLIEADGAVTQIVPLLRVTPHARAHNPTTIGVACLGDFRRQVPAYAQRQSLVVVLGELLHALGRDEQSLKGHDELQGGTSDPNKECPGRHLSLIELRRDVALQLQQESFDQLSFRW
jgi:hypothetical protein